MARKLAAGIVRFRKLILIFMLLAAVACTLSIGKTKINYDLTRYLSDSTMTIRALKVMEEEFGSSEQLRLVFQNLDDETLQAYIQQLNALPETHLAAYDPETGIRTQEGTVYQLVTLTLKDCDASALVEKLRGLFPEAGEYWVGGAAAAQLDVQERVAAEIPGVMLIAVGVVLAVLLITSQAWLEPVIILIVLAISILINMGTNFIFPDVSFVTFAVSAILQLALSIDYAIMLLHSYNAFSDEGKAPKEAMTEALAHSFMPVSSSALTTVAGLLSLLFMSFTIGFDIGIVLSKGILISMLSVFLLMPAVTLLFNRALSRTRHTPVRLGGQVLAKGIYAARKPVAVVLIGLVLCGAYLQAGNSYLFSDAGQSSGNTETEAVNRVFGASDPLVLLVPVGDSDEAYAAQRALAEKLAALQVEGETAVKDISAMVTTGAAALEYYTPADVAELTGMNIVVVNLFFGAQGFGPSVRADRLLAAADGLAAGNEQLAQLQSALALAAETFNGPHYARMLLTLNFPVSDSRTRTAIDAILAAARETYGEDFYLTGTAMSTYDIGNAFEGDLMKVNFITLLAILLIVALAFRSAWVPLLLVFVIEGSIWISMGISRVIGEPIFFISYLICVSIQMGATIDYGILLTNQYREFRLLQPPRDALAAALKKALPTILTSGVILITAGFIIGKQCSVYYISSIGLLLARGALISVVLILTLLPALLILCDRAVMAGRKENKSTLAS